MMDVGTLLFQEASRTGICRKTHEPESTGVTVKGFIGSANRTFT